MESLPDTESKPEEKQAVVTSPLVVALLCALFASSFAGQGARMMMDGHPGLSLVLYSAAIAVCLFGAFWFKIRSQVRPTFSKSLDKLASDARTWIFVLIVLLISLSFSPLMFTSGSTGLQTVALTDTVNAFRKLEYERSITMGRTTFFNFMNQLSSPPPEFKLSTKHFMIISSVPENAVLADDLMALFNLSWAQSRGLMTALNLPNYDRDLDAPKFEGKALSGITIHGSAQIADFIMQLLSNCFLIRRTTEMPTGVSAYYNKLYPTTISTDDAFIWLEIGRGSPWSRRPCAGPGN